MAVDVISHRTPRRKSRVGWAYVLRRLGAVALTIAALATANWLAPRIAPSAPDLAKAPTHSMPPASPTMAVQETDVALDLAGPPRPARRQRRNVAAGIPLTASASLTPDGFEVLSAAELEAISQARN